MRSSLFSGSGEMAALCRDHDWASTPLGAPEQWPVSLRTAVSIVLESRHPMVLFWGPELVQIYNDAYRPSLGDDGRHPSALGQRARDCWGETWDVIGPQIDEVLQKGEASWHEDQFVPLRRNGSVEDVYWTYSYSPVRGDDGDIAGVLVVVTETTSHVEARQQAGSLTRRIAERERMLGVVGRMALVGGWHVDLDPVKISWSDEVALLHGMPPGYAPSLEEAFGFYAPAWRGVIEDRFGRCASDGEPFDEILQIVRVDGVLRWVRAIGEAVRDERGVIRTVHGAFQDIQDLKEAEEALRESDRRFRQVAESLPLVVWSAEPDGRIDYQTTRMHEYAGVTAEALADSGWLNIVHPDEYARTIKAWTTSIATGAPYRVEFRIRRHDGAWRWHLTHAAPFRDRNGIIVKWYGSAIDIHEQVELRREAEALARRLRTTLESVTDAFYLLDPEWRFAFVNAEAERILECRRDDIEGRVVWESFPATAGSPLEEAYRRAAETGVTASLQYFYPPLKRWFDIRAYPSAEGLAVYFRDITEERHVQLRLTQQAELLDRAQDAILVRDLDHTIVYWNAGAKRLYLWDRSEVLGRSVLDLLYEDSAHFHTATDAVLERGEWSGELDQKRKDGSIVTVEARWSLVRDTDGRPYRILAINTDVTERKKLLQQFLRAQRMESIGSLAGGIAHDLNNVLSPILLSIGLLKDDITDPAMVETLLLIEASAKRGADMVQQVLGFARGLDRMDLAVDVTLTVDELVRIARDTFPKNITIEQSIPEKLWPILGDPTQVHQVLMNLFLNARDAMPDGGRIAITAENVELDDHYTSMTRDASPGPHVKVSVVDTGTGMPPDVAARIFDPFFTTKEVGKGTGLGLSTVAAILKSHGGFVDLYSEPGSGTTFTLYFPAARDADGVRSPALEGVAPRGHGETILVVDDEGSIRDITRQTLEAFGYRVVTATDGADAVAIYGQRGKEIDLVLTDMAMPIMDGPATVRALKHLNPDVKIIGASGLGANAHVMRALDSGVEDFLPKPYTADTLLSIIRRVLGE